MNELLDHLTQQVLNKEITLEVACFRYLTREQTGFNHGPKYILGIDGIEGIEGSKPVVIHPFPERPQITQEQFEKDVNYYASLMAKEKEPTLLITSFEIIRPS